MWLVRCLQETLHQPAEVQAAAAVSNKWRGCTALAAAALHLLLVCRTLLLACDSMRGFVGMPNHCSKLLHLPDSW
jgi:hypothetical protein